MAVQALIAKRRIRAREDALAAASEPEASDPEDSESDGEDDEGDDDVHIPAAHQWLKSTKKALSPIHILRRMVHAELKAAGENVSGVSPVVWALTHDRWDTRSAELDATLATMSELSANIAARNRRRHREAERAESVAERTAAQQAGLAAQRLPEVRFRADALSDQPALTHTSATLLASAMAARGESADILRCEDSAPWTAEAARSRPMSVEGFAGRVMRRGCGATLLPDFYQKAERIAYDHGDMPEVTYYDERSCGGVCAGRERRMPPTPCFPASKGGSRDG